MKKLIIKYVATMDFVVEDNISLEEMSRLATEAMTDGLFEEVQLKEMKLVDEE